MLPKKLLGKKKEAVDSDSDTRINIYDLFVVVRKNNIPIIKGCQEDRAFLYQYKKNTKKIMARLTKENVRYIKQINGNEVAGN